MRHPEDEQLLRYADGELPARKASEIRSHLEACWQCRTELEELHKMVGECVRYRKNVLQTHLPLPPAPWGDLYRRFQEIDASLDRPSLLGRTLGTLQFPMRQVKRWAPVAVAVALIWGLYHQLRHAPSVQAAELLRKAIAAADSHPYTSRHIQIRTRQNRLTRLVGPQRQVAAASQLSSSSVSGADTLDSLQALFRKANYSWEDPLSAASYQAWHDQLSGKRDEVTTIGERQSPEGSCYRIRTTTDTGELIEAALKLRVQDLHPVEARLEFRNQEWVEITELAEPPAPASEALAAAGGDTRLEPKIAAPREPLRRPGPSATLGDELRVLAALSEVGADLGDPVEVTRAGGQIMVAGVGIAPQRQQQIHDALSSLPNVVVRFSDPLAATFHPEKPGPTDTSMGAEAPRLRTRMEEQVGGALHFEELAAQLLDLSEAMMSRAYALRRLAERFPPEVEPELGREDRQLLRNLHRAHAAVLAQHAAEIERLLNPVLGSLGGSASGAPPGGTSFDSWQLATEELFRAARHVETLLAEILAVAPAKTASSELPSQLLFSLAQLRVSSEACERLTAQGLGGKDR